MTPRRLDQSARESAESIVVAVILAFLFRGFIAEAFVIPTGSMAPTLQGRHMDIVCTECGHQYRTGASVENDEAGPARGEVTETRCPLCRYTMQLDKVNNLNHRSFNGDRILVSKFAYQIREPSRWDVIVFKYPGNAKINYIKRLVGLPGETLQIRHGDIHILDSNADLDDGIPRFRIQRKPPETVLAMLQLVDDVRYRSARMKAAGWPSRWTVTPQGWEPVDGGFSTEPRRSTSWLRYRHLVPSRNDWRTVGHGEPLRNTENYRGHLITDYYAYNDSLSQFDDNGNCWVGDLALECQIDVHEGDGELLLDLVEGGTHYTCTITPSNGKAQLAIDQGKRSFMDSAGKASTHPTAVTTIRNSGKYLLRFANVDDQLHLWVNDRLVSFDGPTTFESPADVSPKWTNEDAGDLEPVRIGSRDLKVLASHLRVLRDVYYRAVQADEGPSSEYVSRLSWSNDDIDSVMSSPESWQTTDLFSSRRGVTFQLGPDQFFPLGDNSPQSKDARLWSNQDYITGLPDPPPYVERELLIGRALGVYWPHGWRLGTARIGFIPNFQRIGLIR